MPPQPRRSTGAPATERATRRCAVRRCAGQKIGCSRSSCSDATKGRHGGASPVGLIRVTREDELPAHHREGRSARRRPGGQVRRVTRWSKLGTTWRGVSLDHLLESAGDEGAFTEVFSYGGCTTNVRRRADRAPARVHGERPTGRPPHSLTDRELPAHRSCRWTAEQSQAHHSAEVIPAQARHCGVCAEGRVRKRGACSHRSARGGAIHQDGDPRCGR